MTTYTNASDALLDALTRMEVTRLGDVTEAEVMGSSGTYRVRLQGRSWTCSCPSAVYTARRTRPCKHAMALRILRDALPKTPRSATTDERK
ncbi:MAG: SWIM zinc finger domain-containing protein [Intrasporangium sp.]|uniref:SWIM zinc finger family protein n=1 Tax=Intrasporangium sp. TaxID=1925024 RepID=UPI002647D767|nr:SWIM zinc finger family protein [Intrasporangium sp.]MDN5796721.1 SWIM zinc finger domain-containing protein [Intrasporangium sp.]